MPPQNPLLSEILEDFDKEFPSPDGQDFIGIERLSSLKSFISSSIEKVCDEMIVGRKEHNPIQLGNGGFEFGWNSARTAQLELKKKILGKDKIEKL